MSLEDFRDLLERHVRPDSTTAIDGVRICKTDRSVSSGPSMSGTVLAVVAQGSKRLALGDHVYEYGPGQYLIASVDLPVTGYFVDAAPSRPALGFGMTLEPAVIAELLLQAGPGDLPRSTGAARPGIAVSGATDDLVDAIVRLLRLLDRPRDRKALVPLVKREILWRLMTGLQGDVVRQLGVADSSLSHITRAVRWIRENYTRPFRVEELAELSGLSVRLPQEFPGGDGDDSHPVPEAHPAAGGETAIGKPSERHHWHRPPGRIRQPLPVQPGVPTLVRRATEPRRGAHARRSQSREGTRTGASDRSTACVMR